MKQASFHGHLAALFTILIWGTTFVSTKVLLTGFTPLEILLFRFILGYAALCIISPKPLRPREKNHEALFALAGLSGIAVYYLLENIALTLTQVSNVSVVVSTAPIFTAIFAAIFLKDKAARKPSFYVGFAIAILGIGIICFEGSRLQLNPLGDLLSLLAAIVWGIYSILCRRISKLGYNIVRSTRRSFAYGIVFMLIASLFFDFSWDLRAFAETKYLLHILYLGLGASALCFVTWNYAVRSLGPVKTSVYIYLVPVISTVASVLVLGETITLPSAIGILLTLAGLFVSQGVGKRKTELAEEKS